MNLDPHVTRDALSAVTDLSRRVTDAEDPDRVLTLLADAAAHALDAALVVVVRVTEAGPVVSETRGVDASDLDTPEEVDSELGLALTRRLGHLGPVHSYFIASAGGLFGSLVVGWRDQGAAAAADQLANALVDIAATGLDRAFRTAELQQTIEELIASREELARTAALRSLGQMAAVVAHEVKNPLTSIGGVMQVLRGRQPEGSQEHQIIGKVLDRLSELDRMVDELLEFARPRSPNRALVRCDAFLGSVVSLFRSDPAAARVEVVLDAQQGQVAIDQGMFQRVLHNLLINAAHAMDGEGTITLRCGHVGPTHVELTVSDTGPGVPEEARARVFEPFFTTKARGTGLGLAISRQVVEAHGGSMSYRTAPEGGACFVVRLPRT